MKNKNLIVNNPYQSSSWKKILWIAVIIVLIVIIAGIVLGLEDSARIAEKGADAMLRGL